MNFHLTKRPVVSRINQLAINKMHQLDIHSVRYDSYIITQSKENRASKPHKHGSYQIHRKPCKK